LARPPDVRRRRRPQAPGHEEEHENHERWLVTYADMLTVLMALFIVMFALSVVDKAKFQKFAEGLNGDLGNGASLLSGGSGLQQAGDTPIDLQAAITALDEKQSRQQAAAQEREDLERARQKILQALVAEHMEDKVRFKLDERGLVVTVVTDDVLFALGSATLRPQGNAVLDAIAPALKALPNKVTVEGHTDDLPISGRFPSNWELSAERATSVLRYLLDTHAVPAQRLSAAGYADQRPLTPTSPAQPGRRTAGSRSSSSPRRSTSCPSPPPGWPGRSADHRRARPVAGIAGAEPTPTDTHATTDEEH
jgi:chemotaxis protein MotB